MSAERHLLFGLLALQNGLIRQDQLVAAFHAWTTDKSRPLADHIVALGHLDDARRSAIDALAALHVETHGGDLERSLAALSVGPSTLEELREIRDPVISTSLAGVGRTLAPDDDRTATFSVGTATADGQRFRVLRPHAQGGLGAVFVALDVELNREVALKQLLDDRADSPVNRQRFLLEAQITGSLEHPGIVPVYGLGAYNAGRPYYVMRLIRGDSLKDAIRRFHADESLKRDPGRRSLELRKLLRRFVDVCNAIDYAHSRGVVHRDIKPSNVIVGKHGETLVVDWGLAKALGRHDGGPASDERTFVPSSGSGSVETLPGAALGTPGYMSPEQATGNLDAQGPRSDIYGLGATLYCVLTGRPPFEGGDVGEVLRRIEAGEFPAPRALDPAIDRALEAVCLRAMALRPEDRYPTPRALAEDAERWMADEPVSAWREPIARRSRRWARRNRTAVTGAAVALVAGLVGLGSVLTVQSRANAKLRDTNRQLTAAIDEARVANAALAASHADVSRANAELKKAGDATTKALAEARAEADKAKAINDFLTEDLLTQAEPENNAVEDRVTLREVLDRAAAKVGERFAGKPEIEEAVRRTIGYTYHGLGAWAPAERQIRAVFESRRRRLGPASKESLMAQGDLGHFLRHVGKAAEGLALEESAVAGLESILRPDESDLIVRQGTLALARGFAGQLDRSIPMLEEILQRQTTKFGPDHPDTLHTRANLAGIYWFAGRLDRSIPMFEEALRGQKAKLGPDHPNTLTTQANLGINYRDAGRVPEAIALLEPALRLAKARLGPEHPDTLLPREGLARAYGLAGRTAEAIPLLEVALKVRESGRGPDHAETLGTRRELAQALASLGRWAEATRLLEEALRLTGAKFGPDHLDSLKTRSDLARAYIEIGRRSEAIRLLEAALKLQEARLGPGHPDTMTTRERLVGAYRTAGRTAEVIALLESTLKLREKKLGPEHLDTLKSRNQLAVAYWSAHRLDRSIPMFEETLRAQKARLGPDHPDTLRTQTNLGINYNGAGRKPEAIALLEEALRLAEAKLGPGHPATMFSRESLAGAYRDSSRTAEAIALLESTLKLREKRPGPDHPDILNTRDHLAAAYRAAGRAAQAIALDEGTLKLREKKPGPDHPDTLQAVHNLAHALEDSRPAEAEPLFRRALDGFRRVQGPDAPLTIDLTRDLASLLDRAGRTAEAEPLYRRALDGYRKIQGPGGPRTVTLSRDLAFLLSRTGRDAEAIPLFEAALPLAESAFGPEHSETLRVVHGLAHALEDSRPAKAEAMFRRALDGYRKVQNPGGSLTIDLTRDLGSLLALTGRPAEAEPLIRDLLGRQRANLPADSPALSGTLATMGMILLDQRRWSEAEPVLRECLAIRQKSQPDAWNTFNTRSQLGRSLLGQGRFTEAEPLILAGYEGMKAREGEIPPAGRPRLVEAARRIVELYEAWGKPDKATAWTNRLGLADLPDDVFARP